MVIGHADRTAGIACQDTGVEAECARPQAQQRDNSRRVFSSFACCSAKIAAAEDGRTPRQLRVPRPPRPPASRVRARELRTVRIPIVPPPWRLLPKIILKFIARGARR